MPDVDQKLDHRLRAAFGDKLAGRLVDILRAVGSDGSGSFTTVDAPTHTASGATAAFSAGGGGAVASLGVIGGSGLVSIGGGDTTYELVAADTSLTETIVCATGEYSTVLPANLADAHSITNGSADLWRWQTTTGAIAGVLTAALVSTPPANQTIANDATITLPVGVNKIVDNSGNVTGIIMTAGIADGQIVNLVNAGSGSVTFATAATSNVADGTSAVIATLRAAVLVWDSGAARWFRTG